MITTLKKTALALAIVFLTGHLAAHAGPRVVASIKPVHSLLAAIMAGVGEPELLLKGAGSPHAASLRPSQARALARADAVFWIGEGLEGFLEKPLSNLAGKARVIALHESAGIRLLEGREGGIWQDHEPGHDEDESGHDEHGHDEDGHEEHGDDEHGHGAHDMHIWLDPANARAMAAAMAKVLAALDPANAARYSGNAKALDSRIATLDTRLKARLSPVQGKHYVVFHDAYHYFEDAFGLSPVGAVTVSARRAPGARRIREIARVIAERGAACVFAEPQFEPRILATLIEGTPARGGTLDPLGARIAAGPDAYFNIMENLAEDLVACLSGKM